jgi:hypothetical protein
MRKYFFKTQSHSIILFVMAAFLVLYLQSCICQAGLRSASQRGQYQEKGVLTGSAVYEKGQDDIMDEDSYEK